MKLKRSAAASLAIVVLVTTPAIAQISIPIPIPGIPIPGISLPIPFLGRGSSQQSGDPREHQFIQYWNDAVAADRAGDYQRAIGLYQHALAIHPENYQLRLYLSQAFRQAGQTQQAIAQCKQLLAAKPNDEVVWRELLNLYIDCNQMNSALSTGQEFLERFPGSKFHKAIELDVANISRELDKRAHAPAGLTVNDDNYLAYACEHGAFRWPLEKMPLKVFIGSGRGLRKWKDDFLPPVRDALNQWTVASGGMVRFEEVGDAAACPPACPAPPCPMPPCPMPPCP